MAEEKEKAFEKLSEIVESEVKYKSLNVINRINDASVLKVKESKLRKKISNGENKFL